MSKLDKLCLLLLVGDLLLVFASLFPAPAPAFWYLRVAVPEIGWVLFLSAVPAAVWLARNSPKVSLGLIVLLGCLCLSPWLQAVLVSRALPSGMARAFGEPTLNRFPLILGESLGPVSVSTESYSGALQWDVYHTEGAKTVANILMVHGGSWRNGTRGEWPQLLDYLAGRGYDVYSLTYRLAPENPYPAACEDIDIAIERLAQDGVPLFLMGRSSGGHLALLGAYRNAAKVRGVIGFYPPVDMVWSYQNPSNPAVLNSAEALGQFLGGSPLARPQIYREASPIFELTSDGPPTLLIHGGRDSLVYLKQSWMLSAALLKRRVPHYLLELPWMEHGGDITTYGPSGRLGAWAVEDFIQSQLELPPAGR